MKQFTCLAILFLGTALTSCSPAKDPQDPYVILISLDGFSWNLQDLHNTPGLDRIAASGVRAEALRTVYPTTTFANHYSIATGLYPYQHGIVDNDFPNAERNAWYSVGDRSAVQDGSWYGGEPIWVSAEKNGIISASFFFVGSEAAVGGISPTHWKPFDANVPGEVRVNKVLSWLALPAADRPHMITMYFEHVDVAGHDYGDGSLEKEMAVEQVDGFLVQLLDGVDALGIKDDVTIIVVSDHGQVQYQAQSDAFVLEDYLDLAGLKIVDHGSYVSVFMDPYDAERAQNIRNVVNVNWKDGRAYLRAESPVHWRVNNDSRFADIAILANPTYRVVSTREHALRIDGGNHGWDPSFDGMRGIFVASGPRLPNGALISEINNIEIYPLMMAIFGLPLPDNVDGAGNSLVPLLAPDTR